MSTRASNPASRIVAVGRRAARAVPGRCFLPLAGLLLAGSSANGKTWRIGDAEHPWRLHPVSFVLAAGESFRPRYLWGGSWAAEVVVDDDGDGRVDEDPVDRVDDDGDFLWNEDPVNGIDDDLDGAIDEDGPDPQIDNDGDGWINEDGRHTGGILYSPAMRTAYAATPFFRYPSAEEAAADAAGWGSGYGWGDDDADARFNEDPINGVDDDGDGLVDEDDAAPPVSLPSTWRRPAFAYDAQAIPVDERLELRFTPTGEEGVWSATGADGREVRAVLRRGRFRPTDWIRPIRLDSTRNVARLVDDRFLAGLLGERDPLQLGSQIGTPRFGDSGNGQVVDGSIVTAKSVVGNWGFGTQLMGLFWLDRIRYHPRPNFPDRTPSSFRVAFGGDDPRDFRTTILGTALVASRFLIPEQIDRFRPVVKDYPLDPPQKVRVISMGSRVRESDVWEIAEAEYYGFGYALDAAWTSEIIDVGPATPRVRRYFDQNEPWRPIPFELIRTVDENGDGSIQPGETANTRAARQFDPDLKAQPVTWGRVRWRGHIEGTGGGVQIRVRAGSSLDPRIYQRRIGRGVVSTFLEAPILLDWPARGSRLDAHSYVALPSVARSPYTKLPANLFGSQDGAPGGWSPWSAPLDFGEGTDADGATLSLPPLTRYIQFRVDFVSTEDSGARLDYIEFDYASPRVSSGVLAEVFPDTASVLGEPLPVVYALRPNFGNGDPGFNRLDISVPDPEAKIDSLLFDGAPWRRLEMSPPADLRARSGWLDSLTVATPGAFASTVYRDADGSLRLGVKTMTLTRADFPSGQERELRLHLDLSLFSLLTRLESRVWSDADATGIAQPTTAGNAADDLPADGIVIVVAERPAATLGGLKVSPNPFTPNSDGINDTAVFDYSLFLYLDMARVRVEISTLAGRRVRTLGPVADPVGRHQLSWDGLDEAGRRVPPGIYLFQLSVDGGDATARRLGTVAVAY